MNAAAHGFSRGMRHYKRHGGMAWQGFKHGMTRYGAAHGVTRRAMPCHAVMHLDILCPLPLSSLPQAGGLPSPDCCTALSPWVQARCHCDE